MNVIDICSVPIFVTQLKGNQQFTKEEVELLKNIELDKQYGDDGNYLSKESHILRKYKLHRIWSVCDFYVSKYVRDILSIDAEFKMFRSWLSMNVKGTKHLAHSHSNTMLSCILYFDEHMSDDILAPISFGQKGLVDIFKTFQFNFKAISKNQYNSHAVTVGPRTNTMIIFPGWIKHETAEAESLVKRYCLGTNYFFVGESGSGYHNLSIEVNNE